MRRGMSMLVCVQADEDDVQRWGPVPSDIPRARARSGSG
jgi:hypothetical protein